MDLYDDFIYDITNPVLNEYYQLLVSRLTHSNLSLEDDLKNTSHTKNAFTLRDNMIAFKRLFEALTNGEVLNEELITEISNIVNRSSLYISNGYRKYGDTLAETDIPISSPNNIKNDIKNLLQKYNNDWKDLDIYEREARFHIEFIHIHPFEDGNGRTSRLLLNFNLLRQNKTPVIITRDLLKFYHTYMKNKDIEGLTNLLKIQSRKEYDLIAEFYNEYKDENIIQTKK